MTAEQKRYFESKPKPQRDAEIWDAIKNVSIGGTVNTGDAAVGDVRTGKTFSSAVLTNATGTGIIASGDASTGQVQTGVIFSNALFSGLVGEAVLAAGNAEPEDVAFGKFFTNDSGSHEGTGPAIPTTITPASAWVAFMDQAYGSGGASGSVNLSAFGVSHMEVGPFYSLVATISALSGTVNADFRDGALNLTDVDALIQLLADNGTSGDILDLSGGTSAAPTLSAGRVNGSWVITITGTPVGSMSLDDFNGNATGTITFGTDIDVSSANANTIAANLKTFIDDFANPWVIVRVNAVLTITVSTDVSLPLSPGNDSATNLTIDDTAGNPSYIGQIERRGGSVTHN